MKQQIMNNSYNQSYYKHNSIDSRAFPIQGSLLDSPVLINPFLISSDSTNVGHANKIEPIVSSNTMSPTFKSDDMPTLTSYPGPYDFNILIPNGEYDDAMRKGQTCVFQTDNFGHHHLFTKPHPHYWRLNYSTNSTMQMENVFLRMVPVYGDPEKVQCILERCPKHKETMTDENVWKNRSMLLIEKTNAQYFQDNVSKRVCVLVPFEKHAEGQVYSSVNCQFACYNSCFNQDSGGRKTLYLIITLEIYDRKTSNYEVLGRQCLQFRSCACPSRDWRDKRIKGDSDSVSRVREKKIKTEDKSTVFTSTPINMGGKDAIIRVLPSLPGIDEAINALVSGYLFNRASTNGEGMEAVNDVFRQLKNVENCIIEQFTSSYEASGENNKSRSQSPADFRVSPTNASAATFNEYNSIFHNNNIFQNHSYVGRPLHTQLATKYESQNLYHSGDFHNSYSEHKLPSDIVVHFGDISSDSGYRQ